MITYELAIQLRDAGFPQTAPLLCDYNRRDTYKIPTLSELIEACGRKIVLEEGGEESIYWFRLCGWTSDEWMCGYLFPGIWLHKTLGKTPEEATTKLWLKLNKK